MLSALNFDQLIERLLHDPAAEAELIRRYRVDVAVMVVDCSGMVRRTEARGILYALAVARAGLQRMVGVCQTEGGQPVKRIADTLFAIFPDAPSALRAARQILVEMTEFNSVRADPLHPCIGLGAGDAFLVPGVDLFGAEVNRAFVLGEEIAEGNEILATPDFLARVPNASATAASPERQEAVGFPFYVIKEY